MLHVLKEKMVLVLQISFSWHFWCYIKVISSPLTPSTNLKWSVLCIIGYLFLNTGAMYASLRKVRDEASCSKGNTHLERREWKPSALLSGGFPGSSARGCLKCLGEGGSNQSNESQIYSELVSPARSSNPLLHFKVATNQERPCLSRWPTNEITSLSCVQAL